VVDDDRVVGQLLADGLAVMGHAVAIAKSAKEAWQILQERDDIGVVVSDIYMPGSNGLDLALEVVTRREDARAASLVLITGHATIEDADVAMRLGATELLRKPCRLGDLVSAVEKALDKARKRRSGAPGAPALG
jgi:DNA-binding NtrC family response regulator